MKLVEDPKTQKDFARNLLIRAKRRLRQYNKKEGHNWGKKQARKEIKYAQEVLKRR